MMNNFEKWIGASICKPKSDQELKALKEDFTATTTMFLT